MELFTIGHSNRTLEFLVGLLQGYGIQRLVDVRTIPRSRHNPQFNREVLQSMLKTVGPEYTHMPGLGGLRSARKDSPNTAWENKSFRGYADYMQTPEFEENLGILMKQAKKERIAVMCAEAVPWRCHRSLLADALSVRGWHVRHIISRVSAPAHEITKFAHVKGRQVTYPGKQLELLIGDSPQ